MYYRAYTSQVFMGLVFGVSAPTVCRHVRTMTVLLAGHFRLPERKVTLSAAEKEDLLHVMIDGTERPVHRPQKPSKRNATYSGSGKKKRHTVSYQIITDSNKRIDDEARVDKPPGVLVLGDLGYLGTALEIPQHMACQAAHRRRASASAA